MPESVDELKRLSPQERIKRLQELEEERKKEIEQAEELIKETVREIDDEEEKKQIPIPQARATDLLSSLTTAEERQIVATHHLLTTEGTAGTAHATAAAPATAPITATSPQQQKSLEEVAAEEGLAVQQQAQQQNLFDEKGLSKTQQFQRPVYGIGAQQQKSAFGDYIRASQQATTSGGAPREAGSEGSQLERITEFYKERAFAERPDADAIQQSYESRPVTGGYEMRRTEEEQRKEQSDFYKRKGGGPA